MFVKFVSLQQLRNITPDTFQRLFRQAWENQSTERYSQDQSRWVTVGGEQGPDGKKHGGQPVKLNEKGQIQAGLGGKFNGQTLDQAFGSKQDKDRAFEEQLFSWRPMVKGIGRDRFFKDDDLDDFVSEVMLTAWKNREQYDPSKGAFGAWLRQIAQNNASAIRKRDRAVKRGGNATTQSLDAGKDGKTIDVIAKQPAENLEEQLAILKPLISKLPSAQKRAIEGLLQGQTVTQMSGTLGISPQAVSRALNMGIHALKTATLNDDRFSVVCDVERYAIRKLTDECATERY